MVIIDGGLVELPGKKTGPSWMEKHAACFAGDFPSSPLEI
jgi:hypothetical protein